VPICMAIEPVSASANSAQFMAPAVAASAAPTSTGATDADSEKGRAAQNQDFHLGCGGSDAVVVVMRGGKDSRGRLSALA